MAAAERSALALVSTPAAALAGERDVLEHALAPYERARLRAVRSPPASDSYLAAHLLVRQVAARAMQVSAGGLRLAQRCDRCGGAHGQPHIEGWPQLHVSMSHAQASVAAVAGTSPCSIDVEDWDARGFGPETLSQVFCLAERQALDALADAPPGEAGAARRRIAALQLWVRKECLVKLGRLTLDTLAEVNVLPVYVPPKPSFDIGRSTFGDLLFVEWVDPRTRSVGAVASTEPVTLQFAY